MDYFFWRFDAECKQNNHQVTWFFPNYDHFEGYENLSVIGCNVKSIEQTFLDYCELENKELKQRTKKKKRHNDTLHKTIITLTRGRPWLLPRPFPALGRLATSSPSPACAQEEHCRPCERPRCHPRSARHRTRSVATRW